MNIDYVKPFHSKIFWGEKHSFCDRILVVQWRSWVHDNFCRDANPQQPDHGGVVNRLMENSRP